MSFTKPPDVTEYMDLDEVDVFDNAKRSQKTLYHMNSDPGLYPYNNNNLPGNILFYFTYNKVKSEQKIFQYCKTQFKCTHFCMADSHQFNNLWLKQS